MTRAALVNLGGGFAGRAMPGSGEATFWIHGYTLDSSCWIDLWQRLPGWCHAGLDLPGHGNSLPLKPSEELAALARRIGATALAHGSRHLVAHSFGTILAIQVALEYPGTFASLTLGAPMLGGGPFDPDVWTRYHHLKRLVAEGGIGPDLREWWMAPEASLFRGSDKHPDLLHELRRQVGRHPWWELFDDSYADLWQTPQPLIALPDIGVPTLLLVGEDDCDAVKQCAYFLERLVPDCQRRDLSGLGHMCLFEAPADVQPIIEQHWLAHTSPASETQGGIDGHAANN